MKRSRSTFEDTHMGLHPASLSSIISPPKKTPFKGPLAQLIHFLFGIKFMAHSPENYRMFLKGSADLTDTVASI